MILKDGFSGFVETIPNTSSDHFTVADSLMDWYERFGVLKTLSVIKAHISRILQARHHFVTGYTPWANGGVEIVCRQLEFALRSLPSNFRIQAENWPSILPVVQSFFNHSYAPITIMTGLPASTPLQAVFIQIPTRPRQLKQLFKK